jgi:hypothetical protein
MRSVSRPPPSRTPSLLQSTLPSDLIADFLSGRSSRVESNVLGPADKSAPAQNARPAPVTMTTRTLSSASAWSNASSISFIMMPVKALSFSGRLSVIVAILSATS